MKTSILNLLLPTILLPFAILAQEQTGRPQLLPPAQQEAPELTTFDLKFPGGTPQEFVAAIEKAMGKPLNVIIPSDADSAEIPAFEVHRVTLPDLLTAITRASMRTSTTTTGKDPLTGRDLMNVRRSPMYSFETMGANLMDGNPMDTSIWTFQLNEPPKTQTPEPQERFRQFYQLAPYLEVFQVEDITTAVETAWSMKTIGPGQPMMRFHKDTQLLIAMGTQEELGLIEQVLSQLKERLPHPAIDPQTGFPISPGKITN